jgi:hypothetical protein
VGRVGAINTGHLTCGIRGGSLFGTAAFAASKGAADVCFWHKADIELSPGNVRFWG